MAAIILTKTTDELFTLDPLGNEYKELVGATEFKKNRIGEYKKLIMGFTSDTDISGMNLYFDPALFLNSGFPQPFNNIIPPNCWSLALDAAATPGVYDMFLTASVPYSPDLIKNDKAQIEIIDALTFKVILYFYQIYDINNFLNPAGESNRYKLLKDRAANASTLMTSGASVYTDAKTRPRFYVFIQDPADPISTLGSVSSNADNFQAGFYEKNELDTAPYFTNPAWSFKNENGSLVVPGLLMTEKTRVFFQIDSPVLPSEIMVWMIKTNTNDNSVDMKTNYDASFYKVITSNTDLQKDNKIWTPSSKLSLVAGSTYEAFFSVKNTALTFGDKYRFIAIVYYKDDDYSLYEVNSFISNEYTVDALPQYTGAFDPTGKITDFLSDYTGNDLICVLEERLKGTVEFNYSGNKFSDDMLNRLGLTVPNDIRRYLKKVSVEVYSDDGAGTKQIFERLISNKIDPVTYSPAPGLTLDFTADNFKAVYDFRVRYESWIQNLETQYYGVPLITPTANQKWSGRILKIEYAFELYYDDYSTPFSDIIKFRQTIRPSNYTKTVDILNSDDTEIAEEQYYCSDENPCFKAKLANAVLNPDTFVLLTTIEKEQGLSNTVEENEEGTGELTQLDSDKFTNQEFDFGTTETKVAKFCLDSTKLFVDSPYKVTVIAKKNPKEFEDGELFNFEDGAIYQFE